MYRKLWLASVGTFVLRGIFKETKLTWPDKGIFNKDPHPSTHDNALQALVI